MNEYIFCTTQEGYKKEYHKNVDKLDKHLKSVAKYLTMVVKIFYIFSRKNRERCFKEIEDWKKANYKVLYEFKNNYCSNGVCFGTNPSKNRTIVINLEACKDFTFGKLYRIIEHEDLHSVIPNMDHKDNEEFIVGKMVEV